MVTKLLALLVGVAMLGGVGSAYAADVAKPKDSQVVILKDSQFVILTDTQMAGITAGHLYTPPLEGPNWEHKGSHYVWDVGVTAQVDPKPKLTLDGSFRIAGGPHTGCGDVGCPGSSSGLNTGGREIAKKLQGN
jgi:hypothetical protein